MCCNCGKNGGNPLLNFGATIDDIAVFLWMKYTTLAPSPFSGLECIAHNREALYLYT
jgi:hypothetical protein